MWLTPHIRTLSTGSLARKTSTFCCTKCFFFVFLLAAREPRAEVMLGEDMVPSGPAVRLSVPLCKAARGKLLSRPVLTPPAPDAQQQLQGSFLLCIWFHLRPLMVYIFGPIMTLLVVLTAHMLNHPKPAGRFNCSGSKWLVELVVYMATSSGGNTECSFKMSKT